MTRSLNVNSRSPKVESEGRGQKFSRRSLVDRKSLFSSDWPVSFMSFKSNWSATQDLIQANHVSHMISSLKWLLQFMKQESVQLNKKQQRPVRLMRSQMRPFPRRLLHFIQSKFSPEMARHSPNWNSKKIRFETDHKIYEYYWTFIPHERILFHLDFQLEQTQINGSELFLVSKPENLSN